MADPFLGEIRMFSFDFAPSGWAFCDGQSVSVAQNQQLYSLLGNTYGGDTTNFLLPDLRGRVPLHFGGVTPRTPPLTVGTVGGEQTHALQTTEIPAHQHAMSVSGDDAQSGAGPNGNVLARSLVASYADTGGVTSPVDPGLLPASIKDAGGGQGHENQMPYLAVRFVIALRGLFPSHN